MAVDVWTRNESQEWERKGSGETAFQSPSDFVTPFLEIAHTSCFYEVIRADHECKAYFDLQAAPGVWNEQGCRKCKNVIRKRELLVLGLWQEAREKCPHCLAYMILDCSRMTDDC